MMKDQQTDVHETYSLFELEQKRMSQNSTNKQRQAIDSSEYIDYLSRKGAMLPKIAKHHSKQMAEGRRSRLWQDSKLDDTKLFHIDLYHQRAQRKK